MLSLVSTDDEDSGDEEVCLYCSSSKFSDKIGEDSSVSAPLVAFGYTLCVQV